VPARAAVTQYGPKAYEQTSQHDRARGGSGRLECTGQDPAHDQAAQNQAEQIGKIAGANGVVELRVAKTAKEADDLWAIRRALSPAVGALAPDRVSEDISVPRNEFPEIVRRIRKIVDKYNLDFAVYGHAGDGNLHPSILCDMADPEQAPRVHKAVDEMFAATLELGGTLSGEHGIGITKQHYLKDALGEAGVAVLKSIKKALDPKGILNPGKVWPEEEAVHD